MGVGGLAFGVREAHFGADGLTSSQAPWRIDLVLRRGRTARTLRLEHNEPSHNAVLDALRYVTEVLAYARLDDTTVLPGARFAIIVDELSGYKTRASVR